VRAGNHFERDGVERIDTFRDAVLGPGVKHALVRAAHALQHRQARVAEAAFGKECRQLSRGRSVPGQRQDAYARMQVAHDAVQRAAVQRDRARILQGPAKARRRQREGRWLG
jgi:hypothetical protein